MASGAPTSILGVAVRDLGRLRFVTMTVVRHGFGEWLHRTPLARFRGDTTADDALAAEPPGVRLRKLLESLGPTWIKFGQILSSRPDLLSQDYLDALAELQDHAPVVETAAIRTAVAAGLGRPVEEVFAEFDDTPLATASIAQTHLATTHEGVRVVVKVQRPGIGPQMRGDLNLLYLAARVLEAAIDELDVYRPAEIVQAFERDLVRELNFSYELGNLMTARLLVDPKRPVEVPDAFPSLSSRTVLTMGLFPGKPLRALGKGTPEAEAAVEELIHAMCKQVFLDGFFHGDPHPGNLLVDEGTLCFIDWGLAGRLTSEQREDLVRLIVAAIAGDQHGVARVLLRMGNAKERIPMAEFKAEIVRIRSQYLVVGSVEAVDSAGFIQEFVNAAQRFRIQLNPEYALLVKAAATLEGVIRSQHPDIEVVSIARQYVDEVVRAQLSPARMMEEAMSGVTGMGGLLRDLPGHVDQVLHDIETGNLQVRAATPELDRLPHLVFMAASRIAMALFAASTTISAAILLPSDPTSLGGIPVLSTALIVLAVLGWFVLWWWHFLGQGRRIRVSPLLTLLQRFIPDEDD
jgi:ubiquinone biosynthesis protein